MSNVFLSQTQGNQIKPKMQPFGLYIPKVLPKKPFTQVTLKAKSDFIPAPDIGPDDDTSACSPVSQPTRAPWIKPFVIWFLWTHSRISIKAFNTAAYSHHWSSSIFHLAIEQTSLLPSTLRDHKARQRANRRTFHIFCPLHVSDSKRC